MSKHRGPLLGFSEDQLAAAYGFKSYQRQAGKF